MNRSKWLAVALAGAISILAPAAQGSISVKGVSTSSYPDIRVSVVTSRIGGGTPRLTENGRPVRINDAQNLGRTKSVVLALDRSLSMRGKPLADAVAAARAFVAAKAPGDRVAIVGFGSRAVALTGFSTSTIDAVDALRSMPVDSVQGTALYDAIVTASRSLATESLPGRVIIVLTDGRDVSSTATIDQATKEARAAGASVYTISIGSSQFSPAPLQTLSKETGGAYRGASSSAGLGRQYAAVANELRRTWRLTYATSARPGDHATLRAYANGSGSHPSVLELPSDLGSTSGESKPSRLLPDVFYETVLGTQVMAIISFLIVLLAASLALTTVKGSRLRRKIAPHLAKTVEHKKLKQEKERFAAAAPLFRATESAFAHWKVWTRLERLVERSDLPIRTVELVYLMVGAGLVGALISALAGQATLITLALMAAGWMAPVGFVWFKATRRLAAFENQLADVLITLAAALKAGHSFKQGLQTIVDEGTPPASKEFQRVLTEGRLGRPIELGLLDMSERLGSKNFDFVITAVKIQQQVGGSLAGLIDMVADTVRQRQQFIRKVKGLTAMGRAGAYTLVALPFFIAIAITVINPTYMEPLYHSHTGHMLIYSGLAMMAFGSVILKKIVSFKG
ncbi:MAG TPA: VWA domain-containing protein [Gaiellaceae bacterium]|nr:VWA domain-containing protein [Gaiellaceae bacterium]